MIRAPKLNLEPWRYPVGSGRIETTAQGRARGAAMRCLWTVAAMVLTGLVTGMGMTAFWIAAGAVESCATGNENAAAALRCCIPITLVVGVTGMFAALAAARPVRR